MVKLPLMLICFKVFKTLGKTQIKWKKEIKKIKMIGFYKIKKKIT